jgi:hypothetical protein
MGSTSGKYNMTDENSAQNRRTTIPSISLKITKSKNEKKSLPKCIHQDILMDSLSSNKDNFTIVWIDTEIHHQSSNIDIQIKLKNLIHYLRIFDELTAFEHYIKKINQINQEKLFVIISTPLALSMIPHLHHLSSIKYIYIYGKAEIDGKIKEKLLKTYPKVSRIFL